MSTAHLSTNIACKRKRYKTSGNLFILEFILRISKYQSSNDFKQN